MTEIFPFGKFIRKRASEAQYAVSATQAISSPREVKSHMQDYPILQNYLLRSEDDS